MHRAVARTTAGVLAIVGAIGCASTRKIAAPASCSEELPPPDRGRATAPTAQAEASHSLLSSSVLNLEDVKKYIDRFKQSVRRAWEPKAESVMAQKDPRGRCLCSDRRTVVKFTLDRSGAIHDVVVVQSSRLAFLDRVAVEALNEVRQVDGPPTPIFGQGDRARMSFGFVLGLARPSDSVSTVGMRLRPNCP